MNNNEATMHAPKRLHPTRHSSIESGLSALYDRVLGIPTGDGQDSRVPEVSLASVPNVKLL